jgi:hypothetical protein
MKKNFYFKPFFLIGVCTLILVTTSWLIFPDWRNTVAGGGILLISALVGVVSFASSLLSMTKDWKDLQQPNKEPHQRCNTIVNTQTYIDGDVNTEGGSFIGRDQNLIGLEEIPNNGKMSRQSSVTVRNFTQIGDENILQIQQNNVLIDQSEQQGDGNQIIIDNK